MPRLYITQIRISSNHIKFKEQGYCKNSRNTFRPGSQLFEIFLLILYYIANT